MERIGDRFGDLALDTEDIGELAVVSLGPKMGIGRCIDQLHCHAHLIGRSLNTTLENIQDTELFRDVTQVIRRALVFLRRSARDHFQIRHLGQARQNFILDSLGEVGVIRVTAQVVERQNRDRLLWQGFRRSGRLSLFGR